MLRHRSFAWLSAGILAISALAGCRTVKDIPSPFKGSASAPVCSDGPVAQRLYLHKLRMEDGSAVRFEREGPVPGPGGHLLDPYVLRPGGGSWLEDLFDSPGWGDDKKMVRRIYMDMYRPGCEEKEAPPGFRLSTPR